MGEAIIGKMNGLIVAFLTSNRERGKTEFLNVVTSEKLPTSKSSLDDL